MNLSVSNSPFDAEQAKQLNQIFQTLTTEQQIWLSGYLTAQQTTQESASEVPQEVAAYVLNSEADTEKITVTSLSFMVLKQVMHRV